MLLTDSYKQSHYNQYPPGTEKVYSYFESRGGKFPSSVFFGLQYILQRYLVGQVINQEKIDEANAIVDQHFGKKIFNRKGWQYILDNHDGKLPLIIKAVQEGSEVPVHNVLFTVENTDPACFWLPGFVETLLVQSWYPITVATQSHELRKLMDKYAEETGDPTGVPFKLHDFGERGTSSMESAALGGAAHLLSFKGSDTLPAIQLLRKYYAADMPAFSIPATEHSTISSWGRDSEQYAMKNFLVQNPTGITACVSDTYDIWNACCKIWGEYLWSDVMTRDGVLVVRPDSGDPLEVSMRVLDILLEKFGFTFNEKGYKVLDPHIRMIQGDGVNYESINAILDTMKKNKISIDNIAFGMGGSLLQKLNRDTMKFAYKCSAIQIAGTWHDVSKSPVTASFKKSRAGRFKLINQDGVIKTVLNNLLNQDLLETVFENGQLSKVQTLDEIRSRLGTT
jgi:nicotinamide phosphoribosyltransferase